VHIICECPAFLIERVKIYGRQTLTPDDLGSVKELVDFLREPRVSHLEKPEQDPRDGPADLEE
jgi:hypothetical protein